MVVLVAAEAVVVVAVVVVVVVTVAKPVQIPHFLDSNSIRSTHNFYKFNFQLLCTSQLNFLGGIQTILKADSTMDLTYPSAQPDRFNSTHSSLN